MSAGANDALLLMTGATGGTLINDTTARVGKWRRVYVLVTAAVTFVIGGVTSASISIPAGCDVYIEFTSITLGSGTVVVYK